MVDYNYYKTFVVTWLVAFTKKNDSQKCYFELLRVGQLQITYDYVYVEESNGFDLVGLISLFLENIFLDIKSYCNLLYYLAYGITKKKYIVSCYCN